MLLKCKSDDDKKNAMIVCRIKKMLVRKQLVRGQNANYYIDEEKPTNFIKYLQWNKNVHVCSLKKNIVLSSVFGILSLSWSSFYALLLAMSLIGCAVDFQCINLQNYNIYRFKEKEDILIKLEKRKRKKDLERYGEAYKVVTNCVQKSNNDIPSPKELAKSVTTKEELEQLKKLLIEILKQNYGKEYTSEINTDIQKIKSNM